MFKKQLKGLLAMVLAGSMTLTMLPMTALARIDGTISVVGGGTVSPSDITYTGGVYGFNLPSHDAVSGRLTSNNLWGISAYNNTMTTRYMSYAKGDELAKELYNYLIGSENEYTNVRIKSTHKVLITTSDPKTTGLSVSAAVDVSSFPYDINFAGYSYIPTNNSLQEATWTAWCAESDEAGTISAGSAEKYGNPTPISTGSTKLELQMDTVEKIYQYNYTRSRFFDFDKGVTIIQLQNNYKTFEIPVYDGLGRPTGEKISVTNDSTGDLIPVGETEALKGNYKLVYNDESFPYVTQSSYVTAKDGLWSEIETIANDYGEFDVSKAMLVRYVQYWNYGGGFYSYFLARGTTNNDGINYLNGRKTDDYIWEIHIPIGNDPDGKVEVVSGDSFDTRMIELLETEGFNCESSVWLGNKSTIYITAVDPESLPTDSAGDYVLSNGIVPYNSDGQYPVNVSDLFSSLTNGALYPGQKFDTNNWEFWPCYMGYMDNRNTIFTKTKGTVHDKDKITIDYYKNNGKYNEVLVYFPKVDIAPSLTVTAPSIDGVPSITVSSADEIGGYTVVPSSAGWSVGGTPLTGGAKFEAGKQYTFSVVLQPDTGLQFANTTAVKINGNTATTTLNAADGTLRASYTFDALSAPTTPTRPSTPSIPSIPSISYPINPPVIVDKEETDDDSYEDASSASGTEVSNTTIDSDSNYMFLLLIPVIAGVVVVILRRKKTK